MRWIVLIAAGALCGAGLFLMRNKIVDPGLPKPALRAAEFSAGSTEKSRIFAGGVVEGMQAPLELRFETAGRVSAVRVREGEAVHADQVLAELEPEACQLRLAQADAQLQIAIAERDKLLNGRRAANGGPQTGANPQFSQEGTNRQSFTTAVVSKEDQAIANARVTAAEATVELEQLLLKKTRLVAPMDGTILAIRLHTGELAGAAGESGSITIVNRARTRVRAFVEELDAMEVATGQHATVVASGQADRKYAGKILACAPYVCPKSHRHLNPGERVDVRVREIIVGLEDGADLLMGLPVEVFISREIVPARAESPRTPSGQKNSAAARKRANSAR